MRSIQLSKPIRVPRSSLDGYRGGYVSHFVFETIDIRPPGVEIVDHITALISSEGHLPDDAVPRIAARLSGMPMGAISRLPLSDLTAIRHAIEGLYNQQYRRIKSKPLRAI